MGHYVQAILGRESALDAIQRRFTASRVVGLKRDLFLLPMTAELYDALPEVVDPAIDGHPAINDAEVHFLFLSPKVISLLLEYSGDDALAYIETDYFGGVGQQGAAVAKHGRIVLGPSTGAGSINSALQALGVRKGPAFDEFAAVDLGRFRRNEDWLEKGGARP